MTTPAPGRPTTEAPSPPASVESDRGDNPAPARPARDALLVEMPAGYYAQERATAFELLARHAQLRPLELRVALSNLFMAMANRRRPKGPR